MRLVAPSWESSGAGSLTSRPPWHMSRDTLNTRRFVYLFKSGCVSGPQLPSLSCCNCDCRASNGSSAWHRNTCQMKSSHPRTRQAQLGEECGRELTFGLWVSSTESGVGEEMWGSS